MEKMLNLPPASSQLVEPPLKQHHQSEAEQEENDRAFEQCQTDSAWRAFWSSSSIPVFWTSSTSWGRGASMQWETNSTFDDSPISQTRLEAFLKEMELKSIQKAKDGGTPTPEFRMEIISESEVADPHTPYTLISIPAITEEDGGTSGQTVRFKSCFATAGADYCVIAADFTNISELSGKSAMASCGFQDDMKALQEELYAENLRYEREHKQPMSCPEMHRLLLDFEERHLNHDFIVLGGLDSEGKGRVFDLEGPGDDTIAFEVVPPGSIPSMAPILKYELPAKDVLAQLSETEAVELAKDVFRSATNTGDKLEIVVLNAKGLTRENVDLRKEKKKKK